MEEVIRGCMKRSYIIAAMYQYVLDIYFFAGLGLASCYPGPVEVDLTFGQIRLCL